MKYKNPFHNSKNQGSHREFTHDPNAMAYKGHTIHKRTTAEFHIVKNGICVGMSGSVDNCKKRIDKKDFQTYKTLA